MKRFVLPLVVIAVATGLMYLLFAMKKPQNRHTPSQFTRVVLSTIVTFGERRPTIKAMGRVRSRELVELSPEVSGIVLERNFKLRKGNSFKKGEVLIRIDPQLAANSYKTMVSDLKNALASLLPELKNDMPQAYERWRMFFNALDLDSQLPELPQTETERENLFISRFNIFKLYFLARNQQVTLTKYTLAAPFTGTVREAGVYPASMARAGAAVATLVRTDTMEIELPISLEDARFIKPGMKASIHPSGESAVINGTVNRMGGSLDEQMQTVPVFVLVPVTGSVHIMDGAFVEAVMGGKPFERAVAIPRQAVHAVNNVYTIHKNRLEEHAVTIAYTGIDTVFVTEGIKDNDTLVIEVLQDAIIGMAVKPFFNGEAAEKARDDISGTPGPQSRTK